MPPKSKTAKKTSTSSKGSDSKSQSAQPKAQPPRWPEFLSLLPSSDLDLNSVLENQIITISNLWTFNLCQTYVKFLSTLPLTTTPGKPKKGEAVRVNDRFQIDDADFAEKLWSGTALKGLVTHSSINGKELSEEERKELWGGDVLGLNSNIRIYRYIKGQFFDQHYDDFNNVSFPSASSANATPSRTTWTLLLYLSSPVTGCRGGETVFYPDPPSKREAAPPPIVAEPEVGMALLHRHGSDCLLHEGREVTEGEKWIIRSDLCVKR